MKYLLALFTLTASLAFGQVPAGDTNGVVITVNVPLALTAAGSNTCRVLWTQARADAVAAWTAATNANPFYATSNTPPATVTLLTWVQEAFKPALSAKYDLLLAQYNWRRGVEAAARDAALVALFHDAFFSQTAAAQAAQSNAWWSAKVAAGQ